MMLGNLKSKGQISPYHFPKTQKGSDNLIVRPFFIFFLKKLLY